MMENNLKTDIVYKALEFSGTSHSFKMQHPFSQVQCLFFLKCLADPNPNLPVRTW